MYLCGKGIEENYELDFGHAVKIREHFQLTTSCLTWDVLTCMIVVAIVLVWSNVLPLPVTNSSFDFFFLKLTGLAAAAALCKTTMKLSKNPITTSPNWFRNGQWIQTDSVTVPSPLLFLQCSFPTLTLKPSRHYHKPASGHLPYMEKVR